MNRFFKYCLIWDGSQLETTRELYSALFDDLEELERCQSRTLIVCDEFFIKFWRRWIWGNFQNCCRVRIFATTLCCGCDARLFDRNATYSLREKIIGCILSWEILGSHSMHVLTVPSWKSICIDLWRESFFSRTFSRQAVLSADRTR